MTLGVAGGLFGEIRLDGLRKIDARLVGQTDQHPQHVGISSARLCRSPALNDWSP